MEGGEGLCLDVCLFFEKRKKRKERERIQGKLGGMIIWDFGKFFETFDDVFFWDLSCQIVLFLFFCFGVTILTSKPFML